MGKARGDFTDLLIKKGKLTFEQRDQAVNAAKGEHLRLAEALVKLDICDPVEVYKALAAQHRLEYINLEGLQVPPELIELVPESVAREHTILPLAQDNGALRMITSDPEDLGTIDKLRFLLNKEISLAVAPKSAITDAIGKFYGGGRAGGTAGGAAGGRGPEQSVDSLLSEFTEHEFDIYKPDEVTAIEAGSDDAPIIRLVDLLFSEAVKLRASDIHIEPFEDRVRVRYRIDGVLVERESPPKRLHSAILTRLKIMGNIDITERRRPQDGRIKLNIPGKIVDVRVSVLPTNHGQSVVMRLLDKDNIKIGIRDLGFGEEDYRRFAKLIKRPNGIFLVTGPTGSGKTTTLYAALNDLNRPDRKIITAEDPVEYYLSGINQCEVKADIGMTFQAIIRAMLRQAPNIILVGEIRDRETADIAIQASLTGHLVFSTLHTNDAPGSITRLTDIGVQPFLVASSLMAAMAQRLVRKICPKCTKPDKPSDDEIRSVGLNPDRLTNANFQRGAGCNYCNHTGYRGRIGIFEMMIMNSTIRELTFRKEPLMVIRRQARLGGMRTLFEDGVQKAVKGVTTIGEVIEIAGMDDE